MSGCYFPFHSWGPGETGRCCCGMFTRVTPRVTPGARPVRIPSRTNIVNGESHRFVTFTQTDGTEVTACADCGEME